MALTVGLTSGAGTADASSLSGNSSGLSNFALTLRAWTNWLRGAPVANGMVWGVTTENCRANTADQIDAVKSLYKRVMVRTVFWQNEAAASYDNCVRELAKVSDVMAQPIDSSAMAAYSVDRVKARIQEYLLQFGDVVQTWEVGNEVNGEWVGADPAETFAKIEAMYDAAKDAGKRTVLTLYYGLPENSSGPQWDMLPWVDANMPVGHRMRQGLDYVLVSYYEDQNNGHQLTQSEIDAMMKAIKVRFPNAKLGFGEFGWGTKIPALSSTRASLIKRFYSYRAPSVSGFIGGGFYWHFEQTMTPKNQAD
jgi:hypothetical protein